MSLISDPDFILHNLRLGYLRNVDDPYGPRLISLSPSYASNPYIIAASLADVDRWPELALPSSPTPSDDEAAEGSSRSNSGFPGASGLKYTTTIMGPSRTGTYGLRTGGTRKASVDVTNARTSLRFTRRHKGVLQSDDEDGDTINGPEADATPIIRSSGPVPVNEVEEQDVNGLNVANGEESKLGDDSEKDASHVQTQVQPQSQPKTVGYIPKFKGAAEMEARRMLRLMARAPHNLADVRAAVPTGTNLNPEDSSSEGGATGEEGDDPLQDDDDDGFDSVDIGNEFDPEFATTRLGDASESDLASMVSASNSVMSTSNSSALAFPNNTRTRSRLSPVSENRARVEDRANGRTHQSSRAESFLIINPSTQSSESRPSDPSSRPPPLSSSRLDSSTQELSFPRRKVPPLKPAKSALTAMLASTSSSTNPFTEFYAAISGRAETESTSVSVFFPRARKPAGRMMELNVRKDASMEEVLGFALWNYWEEGWLPKLDEGLAGEDDPQRPIMLSAVGWILRIAEEDGEADEDFPPPDRTRRISKFNFDAYAVLDATSAQVQQNKILESKIQRRPSRIMGKKTKQAPDGNGLLVAYPPPETSAAASSLGISPAFAAFWPGSLASSSHGPQMFLRIRVAETADAIHISTTIPVTAGMYMQEVLETVCRKRKMNPNEYALLVRDMSILIPLDRTVASLEGKSDLVLVKRSMLPRYGIDAGKSSSHMPASIFRPMSEPPELQYSSAIDYTGAYKKYVIFRRLPVLVGRHERVLAIDGVYIHIMPSESKARTVFDSVRTSSYNIRSVIACQQSAKYSATFKLVVRRDGGTKRYDFEAESPKLAAEIVQGIKNVKAALERSGTVNKSRRSKNVG